MFSKTPTPATRNTHANSMRRQVHVHKHIIKQQNSNTKQQTRKKNKNIYQGCNVKGPKNTETQQKVKSKKQGQLSMAGPIVLTMLTVLHCKNHIKTCSRKKGVLRRRRASFKNNVFFSKNTKNKIATAPQRHAQSSWR